MEIAIRGSALRKACNDKRKGLRRFGKLRYDLIRLRLDQLAATEVLAEMPPSARCHELKGDRAGQLAATLDGGWRLVFVPLNNPLPKHKGGGLDWTKVTEIEIIEVTNYHD